MCVCVWVGAEMKRYADIKWENIQFSAQACVMKLNIDLIALVSNII